VQTPAARPTTLPAARQPAATPATQPSETPTLPPPPVPSSRVTPGTSKGHVDPNTPETIIVMSQTDSNANQTLMLVNNKTRPAPAPAVNAAHSAPKEGVCTITGEAQQFRRTWRLRYAPLDSEDSHGGSVMLLGEGLNRIREGQQIRVVGTMQPAEERGDAPRFHVQFLEVLSR
jgi:CHASE1-domain containing sensor protein